MAEDKDNKNELGDELKNSLDELVSQNLASSDSDLPSIEVSHIEPLNIPEVSARAKQKAQKTVISCLKLYFDEKLINRNEFLQAKAAVATSNIQTLFNQLKMSEHMMEKLINEMDNGNMQPRMFEVATSVQNTIIEILKNTQLHIIAFQEEAKRMKNELPASELKDIPTMDITDSNKKPNTYLNAKNMLKDLDDEEIEDVEED